MDRKIFLAVAVCALLLFGCAAQKQPSVPAQNQTTQQPTHTAAQAQAAMVKYLFVYYGLYDAAVETPAYSDGVWS
ncbi:MAG: hypothetical protein AB1468_01955, partial [Candidatus Micrarchaeota archaeon]